MDQIQQELQCNIAKTRLDAGKLQLITNEKTEIEKELNEQIKGLKQVRDEGKDDAHAQAKSLLEKVRTLEEEKMRMQS